MMTLGMLRVFHTSTPPPGLGVHLAEALQRHATFASHGGKDAVTKRRVRAIAWSVGSMIILSPVVALALPKKYVRNRLTQQKSSTELIIQQSDIESSAIIHDHQKNPMHHSEAVEPVG